MYFVHDVNNMLYGQMVDIFTYYAQIQNHSKLCCLAISYLMPHGPPPTSPHIVPELSEGTWWSSHSIMHFYGSSGAKDQLPGH